MADYAYVAFLDILGYKALLDSDIKNGTQVFKEKMIAAFRVLEPVNQARYAHRVISDSIFISCGEREAAQDLVNIIRDVFVSFLEQGLMIRGGLSYGEHFQNQTITYSPVLTKAYSLESTVADVSRIMVDSNIIDMFPNLKSNGSVLRSGNHWFVNIATKSNFEQLWQFAQQTHSVSQAAIRQSEKVRMKHRWLQDYLLEIGAALGMAQRDRYLPMFDADQAAELGGERGTN